MESTEGPVPFSCASTGVVSTFMASRLRELLEVEGMLLSSFLQIRFNRAENTPLPVNRLLHKSTHRNLWSAPDIRVFHRQVG